MSTSEPRLQPHASSAEHVLTAGAAIAVISGVISLVSWAAAGASLATFSSAATAAMSAFAAGAGVRALGGLITRFSDRIGVILLGDLGAVLIAAAVVLAASVLHDSSGSGTLTVVTTLGFLLPAVAVLSPLVALVTHHTRVRLVVYAGALSLFAASLVGYGALAWR
ncbi:hypothetical protein E0W80_05450 [Microbacterium sp. PI-1]|uniref:hypothetical protein n=1 Tax=Microbacterium sp. PI-1 TaxID=2545631 RepID=UPI00103F86F6|nr:hypothetical protein [Microbacterium sp. PI-1]TCJ28411.1 hypothetical protein E0W80_05450 [Microbacterium sp. PI-1]